MNMPKLTVAQLINCTQDGINVIVNNAARKPVEDEILYLGTKEMFLQLPSPLQELIGNMTIKAFSPVTGGKTYRIRIEADLPTGSELIDDETNDTDTESSLIHHCEPDPCFYLTWMKDLYPAGFDPIRQALTGDILKMCLEEYDEREVDGGIRRIPHIASSEEQFIELNNEDDDDEVYGWYGDDDYIYLTQDYLAEQAERYNAPSIMDMLKLASRHYEFIEPANKTINVPGGVIGPQLVEMFRVHVRYLNAILFKTKGANTVLIYMPEYSPKYLRYLANFVQNVVSTDACKLSTKGVREYFQTSHNETKKILDFFTEVGIIEPGSKACGPRGRMIYRNQCFELFNKMNLPLIPDKKEGE